MNLKIYSAIKLWKWQYKCNLAVLYWDLSEQMFSLSNSRSSYWIRFVQSKKIYWLKYIDVIKFWKCKPKHNLALPTWLQLRDISKKERKIGGAQIKLDADNTHYSEYSLIGTLEHRNIWNSIIINQHLLTPIALILFKQLRLTLVTSIVSMDWIKIWKSGCG